MDVSPKLLREVEFREQWRGYNPDEVDDFLERLAAALEILQDRLREANDRAADAERRASDSSGTDEQLKRTLVLAQRTADAALQEAREEAAGIVARAREEASTTLGEAQRQAQDLVTTATDRAAEAEELARGQLRGEVDALRRARDALGADVDALEEYLATQRSRLISEVEGQLRWLRAPGHMTIDERPETDDVAIPEPVDLPVVEVPSVPSPVVPIDLDAAGGPPAEEASWAEPVPDEVQWAHDGPAAPGDEARSGGTDDETMRVGAEGEPPETAGDDGGEPTGAHPGLLLDGDDRALDAADGAEVPAGSLFDEDDGAIEVLAQHDDDDPFMTELRRAVNDPEPLGPREDAFGDDRLDEGEPGDAAIYDQDLTPSARFRLRRRR